MTRIGVVAETKIKAFTQDSEVLMLKHEVAESRLSLQRYAAMVKVLEFAVGSKSNSSLSTKAIFTEKGTVGHKLRMWTEGYKKGKNRRLAKSVAVTHAQSILRIATRVGGQLGVLDGMDCLERTLSDTQNNVAKLETRNDQLTERYKSLWAEKNDLEAEVQMYEDKFVHKDNSGVFELIRVLCLESSTAESDLLRRNAEMQLLQRRCNILLNENLRLTKLTYKGT